MIFFTSSQWIFQIMLKTLKGQGHVVKAKHSVALYMDVWISSPDSAIVTAWSGVNHFNSTLEVKKIIFSYY